jgi:hypothetical protein
MFYFSDSNYVFRSAKGISAYVFDNYSSILDNFFFVSGQSIELYKNFIQFSTHPQHSIITSPFNLRVLKNLTMFYVKVQRSIILCLIS